MSENSRLTQYVRRACASVLTAAGLVVPDPPAPRAGRGAEDRSRSGDQKVGASR